ncbi:hypothetical protein [Cyanobium sp. ATX 6F1]|uniref:hypothetical protein n=1 Tax=unclassified Cyanobium TaxID=2627006 RepID=UPI0020CDCD9C|nr:hypothetical protein [Cyanobium sp. ATX 6F1]MCP9917678.1 hypothetical protein [Cyanobium sp. ATX 6F1]
MIEAAVVGAPLTLESIEAMAAARGLLLRMRPTGPAALRGLRVVVARPRPAQAPLLLGELKGWALPTARGLHLDTMRVQGHDTAGVGPLIWAATFAWALEASPCRRARLLAIRDDARQHLRLVRYFRGLGFAPLRELGAGVLDLGPRLIWGGSGLLMEGDCRDGLGRCGRRLAAQERSEATAI